MYLKVLYLLIAYAMAHIAPIEIAGRHFMNTETKEPFFIKGVDYQPGGSSKVAADKDPLSDPEICARDIYLFQKLGVNTVRVYSVSPDLDHDACMTMLAVAGIYLILDVNSPLDNQHLNRYEPWVSYNADYMEHVFKVIDHFGQYNNTLGFFAGNEIINDGLSARRSPPYIRSIVKDMKTYIKQHMSRIIPIGYSAADDLKFRLSLSDYLQCYDENNPDSEVDFYGVNSYQWCGDQTFESSGYDELSKAYAKYSKPVFFSEFGCNAVKPRKFGEVAALFSSKMIDVFCGGLVYEYTLEPNEYGLVQVEDNGSVKLLPDYDALREKYTDVRADSLQQAFEQLQVFMAEMPECEEAYENLKVDTKVPEGITDHLIENGVTVRRGKYIYLTENELTSKFSIHDVDGNELKGPHRIEVINSIDLKSNQSSGTQKSSTSAKKSLSSTTQPTGASSSNSDRSKDKNQDKNHSSELKVNFWLLLVGFISIFVGFVAFSTSI
ncbi:LAMI_0G06986g1_1 [Lachancea mirantina]|uniref:1,3-beta-glucanosyltransferase n=1 Tax=Lachancea mirantina TaxID=1230905 RepID=A0A1G4K9D5_9SACH|nr:LAMI_0G06986g1_1 [Lachancea mirantina]